MIQRIKHGRVQVNENPSKRQRRPRRRPSRPQSQESEKGRVLKPPIINATIDLMAVHAKTRSYTLRVFACTVPAGTFLPLII